MLFAIMQAGTITVTNTNPGGAGSLTQAMHDAVSGDTITFDPSTYGGTIVLADTGYYISGSRVVLGPGSDLLTIEQSVVNPNRYTFHVYGSGNLELRGVTIKNGQALFSAGTTSCTDVVALDSDSIAFHTRGTMYLNNVKLLGAGPTGNSKTAILGSNAEFLSLDSVEITGFWNETWAGINISTLDTFVMTNSRLHNCGTTGSYFSRSEGFLDIRRCHYVQLENCVLDSLQSQNNEVTVIAGNFTGPTYNTAYINNVISRHNSCAKTDGMEISSFDRVSIENSVFADNIGTQSAYTLDVHNTEVVELKNVSVVNNSGIGQDAAVKFQLVDSVFLDNVTISNNSSQNDGGGFYFVGTTTTYTGPSPFLSISNSTITNNTADEGGGIFLREVDAHIINTIIAGNSASNDGNDIYLDGFISATITSGGYNIFGDTSNSLGNLGAASQIISASTDYMGNQANPFAAGLDTLTYVNGMPVHIPVCGSPAIDSGNDTLTQPDQLGQPRNGIADRGAVEANTSSNNITLDTTICAGQSVWGYSQTGTYLDTFPATIGCDTVRRLTLTVNTSTTATLNETICDGGTYISPAGNSLTVGGTYTDTLSNIAGCDSIITINLTVNATSSSSITETACDSYTSPSGNYTWTNSGNYTDTLSNTNGCDSIIAINLTVHPVPMVPAITLVDTVLSIPDTFAGYQWYQNGVPVGNNTHTFTTTTDDDYWVTVVDSNGCDGISAVITVTGLGVYIMPSAPTNLQVSQSPKTETAVVTLNWADNSANELDFVVERSVDGTNWTEIDRLAADVTTFEDNMVSTSGTLHYRVGASNFGGIAYSNTAGITVDPVSAATIAIQPHIQVYPNPTKGSFNINMGGPTSGRVAIYNLVCEQILEHSFMQRQLLPLQITETAGIYILAIYTTQGSTLRKLIIE